MVNALFVEVSKDLWIFPETVRHYLDHELSRLGRTSYRMVDSPDDDLVRLELL